MNELAKKLFKTIDSYRFYRSIYESPMHSDIRFQICEDYEFDVSGERNIKSEIMANSLLYTEILLPSIRAYIEQSDVARLEKLMIFFNWAFENRLANSTLFDLNWEESFLYVLIQDLHIIRKYLSNEVNQSINFVLFSDEFEHLKKYMKNS